jgi:hypothetical protein
VLLLFIVQNTKYISVISLHLHHCKRITSYSVILLLHMSVYVRKGKTGNVRIA